MFNMERARANGQGAGRIDKSCFGKGEALKKISDRTLLSLRGEAASSEQQQVVSRTAPKKKESPKREKRESGSSSSAGTSRREVSRLRVDIG